MSSIYFMKSLERLRVKIRMVFFILNFPGFVRLTLRLRSKSKPLILFVLSDNAFQSPNGRRISHRHLEVFFRLLKSMEIDFLIVRPLFGKRIMKLKSNKIYSAEPFSLKPIIEEFFGRYGYIDSTWERILVRIQPDLVIGQNLSHSILRACSAMNVITAEIQHGVWSENQLDVFGFDLEKVAGAPDYFLTWHPSFERIVNYGRAKALTIGYPSEIIEKTPKDPLSIVNKQEPPIRILVALSIGVVESTDPFGLIRPSVGRVLKDLAKHPCSIVIRPHPLTASNYFSRIKIYRWLRREYPMAKIVTSDEQSIADAMVNTDVVLTFDGTLVIDAVLQGTIVLHTSESEFLGVPEDILTSGLVSRYESYSELEKLFRNRQIVANLEDWQYKEEILYDFLKECL